LIFDFHAADCCSAWDMQPDGSYRQRQPVDIDTCEGSQQIMIARAKKRLKESLSKKKRTTSGR
jgi:hypothetical protein